MKNILYKKIFSYLSYNDLKLLQQQNDKSCLGMKLNHAFTTIAESILENVNIYLYDKKICRGSNAYFLKENNQLIAKIELYCNQEDVILFDFQYYFDL